MGDQELLEQILEGRITVEQLPQVFDSAEGISEEYRFRAVSFLLKKKRKFAQPYVEKLDPDKIAEVIEHNKLEADLISTALSLFPEAARLRESAIRNPLTPNKTLEMLAKTASSEIEVSLFLKNQLRLILSSKIPKLLLKNKHLDESAKEKLTNLLKRVEQNPQFQIRQGFRPEDLSWEDQQLLLSEKPQDHKPMRENIFVKVQRMTAAEKALFAMQGNRDVRLILIRDPNIMVSKAVMQSPKLTEYDVSSIAQMREVDEEILRTIANNRRWMRTYGVVKNLALNPRTPVPVAISLLSRLTNADIRSASRDHNLASPVKQMAIRIARARGLR